MRLDMHVHHDVGPHSAQELLEKMNAAGIDGGVIISQAPRGPLATKEGGKTRLKNVLDYTKGCSTLYPFYWVDPTDEDAIEQVDRAVEAGIAGFKTICTHFYPNDERAIPVYHHIAELGKPYLFHSGILYDGANASGDFNRPCNFEVLFSIPRLRFAMAHISWPWCAECTALFGKYNSYLQRNGSENAPDFFIDVTPGTPRLYREEALTRFLDMQGALTHVTWGTDNRTQPYNDVYSRQIQRRDDAICQDFGLGEDFLDDLYYKNSMRFLTGKCV